MKGITYEPVYEENVYTKVLSIVLMSIQENVWGRLKACPDCRWVFYDHSRNGSKRWCGMYAGEEGKSMRYDCESEKLPGEEKRAIWL